MAEARNQSGSATAGREGNGSQGLTVGVMTNAQDAAQALRSTAEKAAERLPEAVAGAQTAARDTQRALEGMPNQALIMGTSFSIGLGTGLFLSGANRLLVVLSLAPAAAMVATLLAREEGEALQAEGTRRAGAVRG